MTVEAICIEITVKEGLKVLLADLVTTVAAGHGDMCMIMLHLLFLPTETAFQTIPFRLMRLNQIAPHL
jgi:hypothetical protein